MVRLPARPLAIDVRGHVAQTVWVSPTVRARADPANSADNVNAYRALIYTDAIAASLRACKLHCETDCQHTKLAAMRQTFVHRATQLLSSHPSTRARQ